jgi:hypothetical protein
MTKNYGNICASGEMPCTSNPAPFPRRYWLYALALAKNFLSTQQTGSRNFQSPLLGAFVGFETFRIEGIGGRNWKHLDPVVAKASLFDHALTRPWSVDKTYRRNPNPYPHWSRISCAEGNNYVVIGTDTYFLSGDGFLMPTKKDQASPDLRYFKQVQSPK